MNNSHSTDFDPSVFNNTVALQTSWKRMTRGPGYDFINPFFLNRDKSDYAYYKPNKILKIFPIIPALMGVAFCLALPIDNHLKKQSVFDLGSKVSIVFGVLCLIGSFLLYRKATTPHFFDRTKGFYYKGRRNPEKFSDSDKVKTFIPFENIQAIQLLRQLYDDPHDSDVYELNLILKNSERVHVLEYASLNLIEEDAAYLSHFMDVPIWSTF
jgi:hypothetical protein